MKIGETRLFQYIPRSQPTPEGAIVHGFTSHHDEHSILIELPSDYFDVDLSLELIHPVIDIIPSPVVWDIPNHMPHGPMHRGSRK